MSFRYLLPLPCRLSLPACDTRVRYIPGYPRRAHCCKIVKKKYVHDFDSGHTRDYTSRRTSEKKKRGGGSALTRRFFIGPFDTQKLSPTVAVIISKATAIRRPPHCVDHISCRLLPFFVYMYIYIYALYAARQRVRRSRPECINLGRRMR